MVPVVLGVPIGAWADDVGLEALIEELIRLFAIADV